MDPFDAIETLIDLAADGLSELGLAEAVDGLVDDGLVLDFADLSLEQMAENTPIESMLAGAAEGDELFGALEMPDVANGSVVDMPRELPADFPIDLQDHHDSCILAATSQVMAEFGMEELNENVWQQFAENKDVYNPGEGRGIAMNTWAKTLEAGLAPDFRVELKQFGSDLQVDSDAVHQSLHEGNKLIMGIDGPELYDPAAGGASGQLDSGHAVMLKDYNPLTDEYDIVDPSQEKGGYYRVSGERMRRIWSDSGFKAIVVGPADA